MNDDFKGCLIECSRLALTILAIIFGIVGYYQINVNDNIGTGFFMWLLCGACALTVGCAYKKYDKGEEDKEAKQKKDLSDRYMKRIEEKKEAISKKISVGKYIVYKDFMCEYYSAEDSVVVGFDLHNKRIGVCGKYAIADVINLSSVYNVEILHKISSTTHTTTESKGALGRAAVGGLIGGEAGAIIGAATAKQESHSYTDTRDDYIGLRFYLKDVHNPHYDINCKDKKFITDVYTTTLALLQ